MIERLSNKVKEIKTSLSQNNNNWEEAFYFLLGKHWGMNVNSPPFEWMVRSTPLTIVKRHVDNLFQLEALFMGQANLLEDTFMDAYMIKLQNEYLFLKRKYGLKPIEKSAWKLMRMRPSNFPSQRIASFAALFYHRPNIFQKIIQESNLEEAKEIFNYSISEYWKNHYLPDKPTSKPIQGNGVSFIHNLFINCLVPFLFCFGRERNHEEIEQKAMDWAGKIKAESNYITKKFINNNIRPNNSIESQGMLQQFNYYCKFKKCLDCSVGTYLLKN